MAEMNKDVKRLAMKMTNRMNNEASLSEDGKVTIPSEVFFTILGLMFWFIKITKWEEEGDALRH